MSIAASPKNRSAERTLAPQYVRVQLRCVFRYAGIATSRAENLLAGGIQKARRPAMKPATI